MSKIRFFHLRPQDYAMNAKAGGCTIGYIEEKDTPMVELAVSFCRPGDTFIKKIGVSNVRDSFKYGETVRLPLNRSHYVSEIPNKLQEMFARLAFVNN